MNFLQKSLVITLLFAVIVGCGGGGSKIDDKNSTTDSNTTALNKAPTAKATVSPSEAYKGEMFSFDASQSSDSDGEIVEYSWSEGSRVLSSSKSFSDDNFTLGEHTITLTVTDNDGAKASDSIVINVLTTVTTRLKKTGQTTSYDSDGNEVTDGSIKDDGYYQKGVEPSYTRDDNKEVVIDNITRLMWQDNSEANTTSKPWLTQDNYDKCTGNNGQTKDESKCYDTSGDTASTYCANLTIGGYNNWRLPTQKELESIVDYGKENPAIDTDIFKNTSSSIYWSSSTHKSYTYDAWGVHFYYGNDYWDNRDGKGHNYYVRCVRDND
jgi:hypothetical protein